MMSLLESARVKSLRPQIPVGLQQFCPQAPVFLLPLSKGVGRNFPGGGNGKPSREIAIRSLPLLYQRQVRRRPGHIQKVQLKRALRQEPRVKMKTFLEKQPPFSVKKIPFLKISVHFRVLRSPLVLNHPPPLNVNSTEKTKMIAESWGVFTKQILVEKHVNGMFGNPGGRGPPADAHAYYGYTIMEV